MLLQDVKIENFRSIKSLVLPLDSLTVLIGENNSGKSTVLEAIKIVLTRGIGTRRAGQFSEYDFHLKDANASPQTADPIQITLHFSEIEEDEWPDSISQQMNEVIQIDSEGVNHIWLRAKGVFQAETSSFESMWDFLNSNGVELILRNTVTLNLISRFAPLFFLSALRDASQEFGQRGQFWGSFLKSIQLPDEQREQIENMLQEVNTSLISANDGLAEVTRKIADTGNYIPLCANDPVVLEAIPTRIFDMVGKIQVHLKSTSGAKMPLQRYGEGTQSLAVLMLFQAFTSASLAEAYLPESTPILALEEPEAHLHPSAIRSLGSFMHTMTGQILVTSHSGDLVSRIPVSAIRRLYKKNGETKVGCIKKGQFTDRELQAIDYNICLTRGHYLFSRCWLFVEGESDFHLMPILFELMGYSQDQTSFSVVEISQVIQKGEPLIKFAKALEIQWYMMADGDNAGNDYVNRACSYLENGEIAIDRARALQYPDIEHEFWYNGYDNFIRSMVLTADRTQIAARTLGNQTQEIKQLIKAAIRQVGGKPAFAQELAIEIKQRGINTIPQTIQDIITRIVQLAGG